MRRRARRFNAAAGLALLGLLASCAQPARPRPAARAPRELTQEQKAEVDRGLYLAVDAYMRGAYPEARERIEGALSLDPANKDALSLLRRVRAVEKEAAAPGR